MRHILIILTLAALVGAALALRPAATSRPTGASGGAIPASSNQLIRLYNSRYTPSVHASLKANLLSDYNQHGIAGGGVAFHLLRPHSDPALREGFASDSMFGSMWYDFCEAEPRLPITYHFPPNSPVLPPTVHVGVGSLFSNRLIQDAYAVSDGQTYSVEVVFIPGADGVLSDLVDSHPGYSHLDWFGVALPAGGGGTEMQAVLISDNFAYMPFSVTDLLGQFPNPGPVVVAEQLDQAEADLLVSRLGF